MVLPWFCRTSNDFEKMFLISNISMPSNLFKSENSASYGWFRKCHAINQHMSVLCLIMSWSSTSCWWFRCFKNTVFSESIRASTNSMVGSCVSGSPVPVEWRILRCRWLQVRVDWHFFGKLSILMYSPGENSFQLVSWRHIVLISRSTVAYSTSPSDLAREIIGNSWDSCIGKPAKSGGLKSKQLRWTWVSYVEFRIFWDQMTRWPIFRAPENVSLSKSWFMSFMS